MSVYVHLHLYTLSYPHVDPPGSILWFTNRKHPLPPYMNMKSQRMGKGALGGGLRCFSALLADPALSAGSYDLTIGVSILSRNLGKNCHSKWKKCLRNWFIFYQHSQEFLNKFLGISAVAPQSAWRCIQITPMTHGEAIRELFWSCGFFSCLKSGWTFFNFSWIRVIHSIDPVLLVHRFEATPNFISLQQGTQMGLDLLDFLLSPPFFKAMLV